MKMIKRALILAVMCVVAVSCDDVFPSRLMDVPEISFKDGLLEVGAEGGNFILTVTSTGVDDAYVSYHNGLSSDGNGNLYPEEEWITIERVIEDYDEVEDATRDLPLYVSGIEITILPNTSGEERRGYVHANSFTKSDKIEIVQMAQ